ncbi:uncharacterized protein N7496_009578 [Penicillium cataractarum]|uniref:CWF21 domain-containing protein n=1 Tax=Penicillium cataractarum TaxID=2100454 RepID=A0A9W9V2A5_9EURO|nr:uncharacterized protein N7496_009578 [Penicillium cataractarum]KAJ5363865.1 hypothetical protein N7496_009578 [Penicillium cataractarum]
MQRRKYSPPANRNKGKKRPAEGLAAAPPAKQQQTSAQPPKGAMTDEERMTCPMEELEAELGRIDEGRARHRSKPEVLDAESAKVRSIMTARGYKFEDDTETKPAQSSSAAGPSCVRPRRPAPVVGSSSAAGGVPGGFSGASETSSAPADSSAGGPPPHHSEDLTYRGGKGKGPDRR